jgi:phosphomethylpyrimidine synthase
MHFARKGVVTPEMRRVAEREQAEPELIRDEVARGRMVIPANVNHTTLDPMGIGINARCKINANIGNSSVQSDVDKELQKLHMAVHYGLQGGPSTSGHRRVRAIADRRFPSAADLPGRPGSEPSRGPDG